MLHRPTPVPRLPRPAQNLPAKSASDRRLLPAVICGGLAVGLTLVALSWLPIWNGALTFAIAAVVAAGFFVLLLAVSKRVELRHSQLVAHHESRPAGQLIDLQAAVERRRGLAPKSEAEPESQSAPTEGGRVLAFVPRPRVTR
jgi:hypothetical protein